MKTVGLTALFFSLFAGLCYLVGITVPHTIQSSIRSNVVMQLDKHGLQNVVVQVDGRDVTLSGELASQDQINQAIKVAHHRPGVRVVMTELTVIKETPVEVSTESEPVAPSAVDEGTVEPEEQINP